MDTIRRKIYIVDETTHFLRTYAIGFYVDSGIKCRVKAGRTPPLDDPAAQFRSGSYLIDSADCIRNENRMLRLLESRGLLGEIPAPRVLEFIDDEIEPVLVVEDIPGEPMSVLNKNEALLKVAYMDLRVIKARFKKVLGEKSASIANGREVIFRIAPKMRRLSTEPGHGAGSIHSLVHGDLARGNIIVDPSTGRVNGIIDWEYAGFYERLMDIDYFLVGFRRILHCTGSTKPKP